jgi:hypothetical protein
MVEPYQLELWLERSIWYKSAIDSFNKHGDCSMVYYALLRRVELYEWEDLD